jgi:CheY-like chemotaxis protein/anti-sigma regulatory factor (Ser/Thr protein kinase)
MLKLDSFPAITPPPQTFNQPTILVVDDSLVDRRLAGRLLEKEGWQVSYAADGAQALDSMSRLLPQAVLTDLQMPVMDGLALVERMRKEFPRIPVILMTGQGSEEVAVLALKAGAANYVSKRRQVIDLVPAVSQVIAASRTDAGRQRAMGYLSERTDRFDLENDPSLINPLVSLLRDDMLAIGVCDDNGATRAGIALEEALLNALYHGNLEVSSDLKQENDKAFHQLATERRAAFPYCERSTRVTARLTPDVAEFVIADQGQGFDTSKLPDPNDPEVLLRPCGRGLMLMRMFMDEVTYNPSGDTVTMVKRRQQELTEPASSEL